jgi:ectoine hydroxylase-related dioxygenase (phytanoyl-CoA dioxygenase family)
MVIESRIWHATGANKIPGNERPVLLLFFVRNFVRQQEDFRTSVKDDVIAKCSDKVLGFLGWKTTGSVGSVQGTAPTGTVVKRPQGDEYVGVLGGESAGLHT